MDGLSIAASLVEIRELALGGALRAIHEPLPGTFVLSFFRGERSRVLIAPRDALLHVTRRELSNPPTPSAFVMQLRKHLVGSRLAEAGQDGWERVVRLSFVRTEDGRRKVIDLVAEITGVRGNLYLLSDGLVLGGLRRDVRQASGAPYAGLASQEKADPEAVGAEELARALAAEDPARELVRRVAGLGVATARDLIAWVPVGGEPGSHEVGARCHAALRALVRFAQRPEPHVVAGGRALFYPIAGGAPTSSYGEALDAAVASQRAPEVGGRAHVARAPLDVALAKRERTAQRLESWLSESDGAADLRKKADFLLLHADEIGRGVVRVAGYDADRTTRLDIPLEPALDGMENARRLYRRARKLDRGRPDVEERVTIIRAEIARLREAIEAASRGEDALAAVGDLLPPSRRPKRKAERRGPEPFRIGGYAVFVGRSAPENDALLRRAAPDDIWLHARGAAGAHVIVQRGAGAEIPREVLEEAARLAARRSRSDARGKVEVTFAPAKHVRKPKGAPPGLVIVSRGSTLTVEL